MADLDHVFVITSLHHDHDQCVRCDDDHDVLDEITFPPLIFPTPKIDDALVERDAA